MSSTKGEKVHKCWGKKDNMAWFAVVSQGDVVKKYHKKSTKGEKMGVFLQTPANAEEE